MKITYIYALCCPETGDVRYVGKANNPSDRLLCHIRDARQGVRNYKAQWIRNLISKQKLPILRILQKVPLLFWEHAEFEWIKLYRKEMGCKLTNIGKGGEGTSNAGVLNAMYGKTHSPEVRIKISAHSKLLKHSEETKSKISTSCKGRIVTPETRIKLGCIRKGAKLSDDTKRLIGDANRGFKHSEETKNHLSCLNSGENNKFFGKQHTEETKALISSKNKGYKHTEEARRKMSDMQLGRKHSEESKLKRSESLKKFHQNKKFLQDNIVVLV